jgi:protease IV
MQKRLFLTFAMGAAFLWLAAGCVGLKVSLETESKAPLKEYTLQGSGAGKILLLPIRGFISQESRKGLLHERAGLVQEVAAQLKKAAEDPEIKGLLLEINSPGGTITASDILYHEIQAFKEKTGIKIVSLFMDLAASGAYYLALPSDRIMAHPTTLTGSIGVIFLNPKVAGTMDKLGLAVEVSKSGLEKDMGSPFRASTPEEKAIFQSLTDKLGRRFLSLVARHRNMSPNDLKEVASARIYLADEAAALKLVDRVGYLDDALTEAKTLAGLSADARVVVYRRTHYPNDTPYNVPGSRLTTAGLPGLDLGLPEILPELHPGFYYLWMPGNGAR